MLGQSSLAWFCGISQIYVCVARLFDGAVWFEQSRECSAWNVALKELCSRLLEGLIAFRLRKLQTGLLVLPILST